MAGRWQLTPRSQDAPIARRARHDEAAGVTSEPRVPRVPPLSPLSRSPPLAAMASRSRSRSPLARDGSWLATRSRSRSPGGGGGAASVGGGGAASVGGGGAAAAASGLRLLRIRTRDGVVTFVDDGALSEGAQVVMEVEPNSSGETIRTIRAHAEVGPIRWT